MSHLDGYKIMKVTMMKKIIKLMTFFIALTTGQAYTADAAAVLAADLVLFKGIMLSTTDPLASAKPADYEQEIRSNTKALATNCAAWLVTGTKEERANILFDNPYNDSNATPALIINDFTGLYHASNGASLRGLFDDTSKYEWKNPTDTTPSLIKRFDVIQRLLYLYFKRLPVVATTFMQTYGSAALTTDGNTFNNGDPLSLLYKHVLDAIEADATLTGNKTALKKYVIDSGSLFKQKLLAGARAVVAPQRTKQTAKKFWRSCLRRMATPAVAVVGVGAFATLHWVMLQPRNDGFDVENQAAEHLAKGLIALTIGAISSCFMKKGA